jgi:Cellulase (glycosyl hydrolase family 5)
MIKSPSKLFVLCAVLVGALLATAGVAAAAPLSVAVVGNHFVNGEGQTIRLLGVDRTSSEYGCVDGFGYNDGHYDDGDAAAIASWNANAVRVPLNEDCWLGLNKQPTSENGLEPKLTAQGYRESIVNYVAALNAHGLYAILDLHWTAPGAQVALEQQPMPDFEHSPAFWQSVAETFEGNPAVVFDVFNEPFDPTDPRSGEDPKPQDQVTWNCWDTGTENGPAGGAPCVTTAFGPKEEMTAPYRVAGLQTLIDEIRATGATQPVLVGGLNFSNDLSQWLEHAPVDPLGQEAASFHNYPGQECDNVGCWGSVIARVAGNVPVVTGEFAEDVCTPANFDNEYVGWADANGVSYLAWGWVVLSAEDIANEGCSAYQLISDYGGTPDPPNGTDVHAHLLTLPAGGVTRPSTPSSGPGATTAGGKPQISLLKFQAKIGPGNKTLRITLDAATSCQVVLTGQTLKAVAVAGHRRRHLPLGSASFALAAKKPKTVLVKLPATARGLLVGAGSLRGAFTVKLSSATSATTVLQRSATLKARKADARGGRHKS